MIQSAQQLSHAFYTRKNTIYYSGNNTGKNILSALKAVTGSDAEAYFCCNCCNKNF